MIRLAHESDLPRLLEIYDSARSYMWHSGNPTQWSSQYPGATLLLSDIAAGQLYVLEEAERICACFMLSAGPDPTYLHINGQWAQDAPYGVLHRVASDGSTRRVVSKCVEFAAARFSYLRIDTHEQNIPMQKALQREGFVHRGTILTHDGTPRLAYDR